MRWRHQGFGDVWDLAVGDFLGNGEQQIAVGGRRPLLLSPDGSELIWYRDWEQDDNLLRGGDNDWVYTVEAVANDQGSDDLLLSHSMGGASLLSGKDGTPRWSIPRLDQRFPFPHLILFGDPASPSFFPKWGRAAYSVKTGEVIWENPRASDPAAYVLPARKGSGAPTGLYLVSEGQEMIGGPGGGGAWRAFPNVASLSASGEELFSVEFRDGDDGILPLAAAAADLDGAGVDSVVVALFRKPMRVYDAEGELRWEKSWNPWEDELRTRIGHVFARDLDGDGRDEIIVIARDSYGLGTPDGESRLLVLDWEGNERFELAFNLPVVSTLFAETGDGAPLLLLGTGTSELPDFGHVVGIRLDLNHAPDFEALTEFEFEIPAQAKSLALLGSGPASEVIVGTDDGILWATDLAGEASWNHHLGNFFSAISSIPGGEGDDWVAYGDNSGTLALLNPAGEKVWHRFMEVGTHGSVAGITPARLEAGGDEVIAAIATARTECCWGTLEVYSLDGERLLQRVLPGEALGLAVADLHGGGADTFLVLEGMVTPSDVCKVRAYDKGGFVLWEAPIAKCQLGEIQVGEMDGSGKPSIGVRTHPLLIPGVPTTLTVLSHDGSIRWHHPEEMQTTNWIRVTPLGLLGGGNTTEQNGFVELRGPDDEEVVWRTLLDPRPDPANPARKISGQTSNGIILPHQGGFRVALSNWSNDVYLLEGSSGEEIWSVFTETEENWISARHRAGPVTFVPQTGDDPPYLLFAQNDSSRRRSEAMAISMDGEIMSRQPILSPSTELSVVQTARGTPSVAVKTLLGIYAFELMAGEEAAEGTVE